MIKINKKVINKKENKNIYVMSDIHGCYDKFIAMLKLINFKQQDELYILGDIFDRGSNPLEILDYIVGHSNIYLLKGNHEKMFEEFYETNDISLWYYNGGKTTHESLLNKSFIYEENLYKYIKRLPIIQVINNFILVHAGLEFFNGYENLKLEEFLNKQLEDMCLWTRNNIGNEKQFKNYTIICGHTPVQVVKEGRASRILKAKGTIYIDCGCVFQGGKLACLNIMTMEEYYI